jgi:hypothetical protein
LVPAKNIKIGQDREFKDTITLEQLSRLRDIEGERVGNQEIDDSGSTQSHAIMYSVRNRYVQYNTYSYSCIDRTVLTSVQSVRIGHTLRTNISYSPNKLFYSI